MGRRLLAPSSLGEGVRVAVLKHAYGHCKEALRSNSEEAPPGKELALNCCGVGKGWCRRCFVFKDSSGLGGRSNLVLVSAIGRAVNSTSHW